MTSGEVRVRVEGPGDADAVRAVETAAFGRPDEADLVDALRADACWVPGWSFVAESVETGEVVGHLLFTRLVVGGGPAVSLAPLAVVPSWQRRGVGSALVRAGVAALADAGERLVVVLGEPAYYGRFGFGPAAALGVTGPFDDAGDAFQALRLDDRSPGPPMGEASYPAPFLGPVSDPPSAPYSVLVAARPDDVWLRYDVDPGKVQDPRVDGSVVAWTSRHPIRRVAWVTAVGEDADAVTRMVADEIAAADGSGMPVSGVTVPQGLHARLPDAVRPPTPDDWTWWYSYSAPAVRPRESAVVDLDPADPRILDLLEHSSSAYVFPGDEKIKRWVGVFDGELLVACAAHVEHIPGVPHLASVCTRPSHRGRGLAGDVCSVLTRDALAAGAPVVTLGMYASNDVARKVYDRLGFTLDKAFTSGWLPGRKPPEDADPNDVLAADAGGTW
ncbi:MAG: GNAT family N-acetyltransferase [Candidatus Nanopelagicales bacterium]